jgi:predicted 2-oxoglutarate/Fe(II)-dependent dioxygenase YbiX
MNIYHHGSGIVQFGNPSLINQDLFKEVMEGIEKNTLPQGYTESPKSKDAKLNNGLYEYSEDDIQSAPIRYNNYLYEGMPQKHIDFILLLEDALYKSIVQYAVLFPVVINSIRWRTRGYFIRYENGQGIGPHSDCDLPYGEDNVTPLSSFPLSNTVTAAVVLNEDYAGGELSYAPWGIEFKPKIGDILMYPSSYAGCHSVNPVTQGVRYAYLSWFAQGRNESTPSSVHETAELDSIKWVKNLREDAARLANKNPEHRHIPIGEIGSSSVNAPQRIGDEYIDGGWELCYWLRKE